MVLRSWIGNRVVGWRSLVYYLFIISVLVVEVVEGKKKTRLELKRQSTASALFYVGLAIALIIGFLACTWCCRQICPNGPSFSALDLDEIRLEKLDDIEQSMKKQIRELQTQLNNHQKKKAEIMYGNVQLPVNQSLRDERRSLLHDEEMGLEFDSPQKKSTTPYRRKNEDLKTPEPVSISKPLSTREEKDEEKDEDLWQLWNRMYSTTGKSKEKEEEEPKQSKEYAYKSIKFERKAPPPQRSPSRPPANPEPSSPMITSKVDPPPNSIPKTKPPPPLSPPPTSMKTLEPVKIGTGAVVEDDYKIDIEQVDHQYRNQVQELKPLSSSATFSPMAPPVHKPSNSKIEFESPSAKPNTSNVTRRPAPPRGPPPGFRKPRPPPPKLANNSSSKKD